MNGFAYFLRIAINNALRSGQRGVVALLCIAFGVMSLIAMLLLLEAVSRTIVTDPQLQFGSDLSMGPRNQEWVLPEQLRALDELQAQGVISQYTPVAVTSSLMFRIGDSVRGQFASNGIGVDPAVYPLVGDMVVDEPAGRTYGELIAQEDAVVITRDIAVNNNLRVGDMLTLSDLSIGAPVRVRVSGILSDTPNHHGGRMYYSHKTASKIGNGGNVFNTVLVNAPDLNAASRKLEAEWSLLAGKTITESQAESRDLMDLFLKGIGVLALLVGGIGIANTIQVLLTRRRREMAIWKTLGYTTRDLYVLFAGEAALYGIIGSLLGVAAGLAISFGLIEMFVHTVNEVNLAFRWEFSALPVFVGMLAGIVTTVLFALWAIVLVSRVEPMSLLRSESIDAARVPWWQSAALAILLAIPFAVLTSWIMGSAVQGLGVLLFGVVAMSVLAVILGSAGWFATTLLPFGRIPILRISQTSLRRRGVSLLFAMMALFVGVVALATGIVLVSNAGRELDARTFRIEDYNTIILAPASQEPAIRAAIGDSPTATLAVAAVQSIKGTGEYSNLFFTPEVIGASEPHTYEITGEPWSAQVQGVYLPAQSALAGSSQVEITTSDGRVETLPVSGTYRMPPSPTTMWTSTGVLMPLASSSRLTTPDLLRVYTLVNPDRITTLLSVLRDATVIDLAVYAARFTQTYYNLYLIVAVFSGLALLAGLLLIANAVSLAMLDRQYELGVLKTIGYTRRDLLFTLGVEYSTVALIVSTAGIVVVQLLLLGVGIANGLAARILVMSFQDICLILAIVLALMLGTVLLVSWQPIRRSPVFILNDRA